MFNPSPYTLIVGHCDCPGARLLEGLVRGAEFVIAADGGLFLLEQHQLQPHVVVGDLDSYYRAGRTGRESFDLHFFADQNSTDLDKSLSFALEQKASRIVVTGFLGGNFCHELSNINSLQSYASRVPIEIEEEGLFGRFMAVPGPRDSWNPELVVGSIVSIFSFSGAAGVCTQGLVWELDRAELRFGKLVSLHNLVKTPQVHFKLSAGSMLVIVERAASAGPPAKIREE